MKLKIFLRKENMLPLQLSADMKKTNVVGEPWRCNNLFHDFSKTPHIDGYELKRWKVKRGRQKWRGLANEVSPELREGDEITFYASEKKAGDSPGPG